MTNTQFSNILSQLSIDYIGHLSSNSAFVVDLDTDLDFGHVYSLLETNDKVEHVDDVELLTIHNASLVYEYKNVQLTLKGDFDNDLYQLVLTEIIPEKYE